MLGVRVRVRVRVRIRVRLRVRGGYVPTTVTRRRARCDNRV